MIEKFIENLPAIITAIGGVWLVIHPIKKQVEEIQHSTNSMKDALVAAAKIEGHATGVKDESIRKDLKDALVRESRDEGVQAEKARQGEVKKEDVKAVDPDSRKP